MPPRALLKRNPRVRDCWICGHRIAARAGLATTSPRWAQHPEGTCPGPPRDLSGLVYAVTRIGPLCDLIKVGMTRNRVYVPLMGRGPTWRPMWIRIGDSGDYWGIPEENLRRRDLLRQDPPRAWAAEAFDRASAERAVHQALEVYRPPFPIPPDYEVRSYNGFRRPRYGRGYPKPIFGKPPVAEQLEAARKWQSGTADERREAAWHVSPGREVFRAPIDVVLSVIRDVTGNSPEEVSV